MSSSSSSGAEVLLMVRRKNTTIYLSESQYARIEHVKEAIQGIVGVPAEDLRLYRDGKQMEDGRALWQYGIQGKVILSPKEPMQDPFEVGMVFKDREGQWEELDIADLSLVVPPEEKASPAAESTEN